MHFGIAINWSNTSSDGVTSKYAFAAPREDGVEDDEEADTETIK